MRIIRRKPFTQTIFAAILAGTGALGLLWLLWQEGWAFTFASILAYLVFDLVSGRLVKKVGKGKVKFPFSNLFQSKQNAYFLFLFGEVIGISILIAFLTQVIAETVKPDLRYALFASFLACLVVGIDFFLKYDYQRRRSQESNQ